MSPDVFPVLLSALGIAAFERRADGAFTPVAPPPDWLRDLSKDMTFPFLGAFLDEAREFWGRGAAGRVASGLCAETDEQGREFHFEVSAVAADGRHFLVFELAQDAEQVRAVLQKSRELALDSEGLRRRHAELIARIEVLAAAGEDAQGSARVAVDLTRRLGDTAPTDRQRDILVELRGASERLLARVDALVETSRAIVEMIEPR
jgi:hypothetical protein